MTTETTDILFISHAIYSHSIQMKLLAEELAARGVEVRYAIPAEGKPLPTDTGVKYIAWEPQMKNGMDFTAWAKECRHRASLEPDDISSQYIVYKSMVDSYEPMYRSLEPIYRACRPSLVFTSMIAFPAIDLAAQLGIPCCIFTCHLPEYIRHRSRLVRAIRGLAPKRAHYQHPSLLSRIKVAGRSIVAQQQLKMVRARLTGNRFQKSHFNSHPVVIGTHKSIEDISEMSSPRIHMVGPILPEAQPAMDPSLKQWLDDSGNEGVVLAAFGNLVALTSKQVVLLARGLKDCRCRVLWSVPMCHHETIATMSSSFRVQTFVPQFAVLGHPAVRLFVSHCGSNSVRESLYWGKPILGMPFFLDQPYFADRIASLGVGLLLDRKHFLAEEVRRKASALLADGATLKRARRISRDLKERCGREIGADILQQELMRCTITPKAATTTLP